MNRVTNSLISLKGALSITDPDNFHCFFIRVAIDNLLKRTSEKFDSVLALGATHAEAEEMIKFPFKKIVLSGVTEPDIKTKEIMKLDKRVTYIKQDLENLSYKPSSFDLVFVKEALHHVPRPVKGLYEMLRVAKKAAIFIEPEESSVGNFFSFFNLDSKYERNQKGNLRFRDNFVYRWRKREIIKLLNSYYLESGYNVNFTSCWMSNRYNITFPFLMKLFILFGWVFSLITFKSGNNLICTILPGKDLPN